MQKGRAGSIHDDEDAASTELGAEVDKIGASQSQGRVAIGSPRETIGSEDDGLADLLAQPPGEGSLLFLLLHASSGRATDLLRVERGADLLVGVDDALAE